MEEYMKRRQMKKAFTMIELVVAISLFIILSMISFMYFFSQSNKARDGVRVTDIRNLERALEMYSLNKGGYPAPFIGAKSEFKDASGTIKGMWKQGLIEEQFVDKLGELNKTPVDPLTGAYYLYSKASGTDEYQILVGYEQLAGSHYMQVGANNNAITNQQVEGNYNGYYVQAKSADEVSLLGVPTIITGNISEDKLITAGETIPVKISGENKDVEFILTELGDKMPKEDDEVQEFMTKLKQSYLTGELDGVNNYDILDNLDPNGTPEQVEESIKFGRIILGTSSTNKEVTVSPCYDPYNVKTLHGALSVPFWTRIGVSFEEIHSTSKNCDDYKKEFVCNNGTREDASVPADTTSYKYTSCVDGLPQDCLATSVDYTHSTYGNFTTNYPDTTHNDSTQNTITKDYNKGNYDFIFSSQCFNGSFINHNINRNKLNSCNTNYHTENNIDCILNTKVCNTALGSGTQTRSNGSRGECVLESCISGYHLEHGECLANEQDCTPNIPNAIKAIQTWNFDIPARGACTPIECKWGYVVEGLACTDAIVFEDNFTTIGDAKVYKGIDKRITFTKDDVSRDLLKIVNTNDNSEQIWMAQNMGANESYTPVILPDNSDDKTTHKNSLAPDDTNKNNIGKFYQWGSNKGYYKGQSLNKVVGPIDCSGKTSDDFDDFYTTDPSIVNYCSVREDRFWHTEDKRGPCPQGYYIPTVPDFEKSMDIIMSDSGYIYDTTKINNYRKAMKYVQTNWIESTGEVTGGNWGALWTSEVHTSSGQIRYTELDTKPLFGIFWSIRGRGIPVRCVYSGEQN